ncbi:hypothetical protein Psta_2045 [Pirellula staleyi DSM 6068]|uniref:Uncharacterized protein n=1 Tax=Pirellula staleyi (strain ATCC 27377 / DSM 6068 / ICPB 4128) TaxID=530564 RepID=D2R1K0_PIRSD|nr:hypothetical protein [Pirellula staleyi]ADB16719.1 hypothetical protein Psta_2045 [Pirellula staleyi DSM 6068]
MQPKQQLTVLVRMKRRESVVGISLSAFFLACGVIGITQYAIDALGGMPVLLIVFGIAGGALSLFGLRNALPFYCFRCSEQFYLSDAQQALASDRCPACHADPFQPREPDPLTLIVAEPTEPDTSTDQAWMREKPELLGADVEVEATSLSNPYASTHSVLPVATNPLQQQADKQSPGGQGFLARLRENLGSLVFELTASVEQMDELGYLPTGPTELVNFEQYRAAAVRAMRRSGYTRLARLVAPFVLAMAAVAITYCALESSQEATFREEADEPILLSQIVPLAIGSVVVWVVLIFSLSILTSMTIALLGRAYRKWAWGNPPTWPAIHHDESNFFGIAVPLNSPVHPSLRVRLRTSQPQAVTILLCDDTGYRVAVIDRPLAQANVWETVPINFLLIARGRPGGTEIQIRSDAKIPFEVDDIELLESRWLIDTQK